MRGGHFSVSAWLIVWVIGGYLLQGCIVDEYYYVPRDQGIDATLEFDAEVAVDTRPADTGVRNDGGVGDAGVDSAVVQVGPRCQADAGPDGASDASTSRYPEWCGCATFGQSCAGGEVCPSGTLCLDNGCGAYCLPAGAGCFGDADCAGTSTCEGGRCRPGPRCVDSRDCPDGFACESERCIDRRVPCVRPDQCPWGYVCQQDQGFGFCKKLYRRCNASAACGAGYSCVDIDNIDGGNCVPEQGVCASAIQCSGLASTRACGSTPLERRLLCVAYGPCANETDCGSGQRCLDLWGDGQKECAPNVGTCTSSSQCSPGHVCAVEYMATRLACFGGMFP